MFGWFNKNKKEKDEIENAEEESDPNSKEEKKIPKVTFSEYLVSDDEPDSNKNLVTERQVKQLSNEEDMAKIVETMDIKDKSELKKKKEAVNTAKRLISEVSKKNIAESDEKFGKDPSALSKSLKEISKVTMSKHVVLDDRPEMSKEIVDEHQAKQLVSDVWEEAFEDKMSKSETDFGKKEDVFDKPKKIMSSSSKKDEADSNVKIDHKPKTSVQEIPKGTMSKRIILNDKSILSKEMIGEEQAKQLISEVSEKEMEDQVREKSAQEDMRDLKKKEVAVDEAKKIISAVSKRNIAFEEEKSSEVFSESDEEKISKNESAVSKAKLLLSRVSQREVTDEEPVPTAETAPKPEEQDLEVSEVQMSVESLKIDHEGGTEYDIQDIVNEAGYGKFQRILFFLCGIAWMIANYELMLITMFGGLVACEWTIYGWQNACLSSTVFIGIFVGALTFGMMADNFGRKRTLGMSTLLLFVTIATTVLSKKLTTLLIFRCLFGFALGGLMQVFVLGVEYYPIKERGTASIYLTFYWSAGALLLIITTSFIMQTLNSWRWLLIVCSLPVLCLFKAIKWYPESARFYLVSSQYNRAVKLLEQMLEMNKVKIPPGRLKKISKWEERGNLMSLLRKEYRVTTLMLWYICFAVFFTYYGIILLTPFVVQSGSLRGETYMNSTDLFTTEIPCQRYTHINYVHLFWTTASEIPGLFAFIVLIEHMQRKMLLSTSCFVTAILFFILLIHTKSAVVLYAILFFVRASAQASCMLSLLMMSEVYPTTMRAISFGSAAAFAALGGAMVPFVTQALFIQYPVPTTCTTGALILLAGIVAACLPRDTKDAPLEDLSCSLFPGTSNMEQKH